MAAGCEPPPVAVPAFVPICPPLLPRAPFFRHGRRVGVGVAARPRVAVRPAIGGRHGGRHGRGGGSARHAVMMAENYATAEGQSIEEVFSDRRLYYLPGYQRNYSWDGHRARQFLQSIVERVKPPTGVPPPTAAGGGPSAAAPPVAESPAALRAWFKAQRPTHLNFIVLFADPGQGGKLAIVDGQQRLITLCFVLGALRELFRASPDAVDGGRADDLHGLVWQRVRGATCDAEGPRIAVRPLDRELFRAMTLTPGGMQAYLDVHNTKAARKGQMQSHVLMLQAQHEVLSLLTAEPPWVRRRLAGYLMASCCVGAIVTKDRWTAQELFSVLNFRGGLQLEPIDRFRSGLIIAQEKVLATRDGDDGDPFFDSALAPVDADDEAGVASRPPHVAAADEAPPSGAALVSAVAEVVNFERIWDDLDVQYGRPLLRDTVLFALWAALGFRPTAKPGVVAKGPILSESSKEAPDQFARLAGLVVRASADVNETPQEYLDTMFRRRLALHQMVDRAAFPEGAAAGEHRVDGGASAVYGGRAGHINHLLRMLQLCKNARWMPAVLEWFLARGVQPTVPLSAAHAADAVVFLTALDRAVFTFSVLPKATERLVTAVEEVLRAIADGKDPLPPLSLSGRDWRALERALMEPRFGSRKQVPLYVLQRTEEALLTRSLVAAATVGGGAARVHPTGARGLVGSPALVPSPKLSIEHVYPVDVPAASEWTRAFPSSDEAEAAVQCLGNLSLLSKSMNSRASNDGFGDKVAVYRNTEGTEMLALTADVLRHPVWDAAVVRERQARLVGVLMEHFGPPTGAG